MNAKQLSVRGLAAWFAVLVVILGGLGGSVQARPQDAAGQDKQDKKDEKEEAKTATKKDKADKPETKAHGKDAVPATPPSSAENRRSRRRICPSRTDKRPPLATAKS